MDAFSVPHLICLKPGEPFWVAQATFWKALPKGNVLSWGVASRRIHTVCVGGVMQIQYCWHIARVSLWQLAVPHRLES